MFALIEIESILFQKLFWPTARKKCSEIIDFFLRSKKLPVKVIAVSTD